MERAQGLAISGLSGLRQSTRFHQGLVSSPANQQGPPCSTGLMCKSLEGPNEILDGSLGCGLLPAISTGEPRTGTAPERGRKCSVRALKREHRAGLHRHSVWHLNILHVFPSA